MNQGTKKSQRREQVVVLLVGWFPLAVSSVLTAVFCCGGESALPAPRTTLCQQEVSPHEIKCNICLKWLKLLLTGALLVPRSGQLQIPIFPFSHSC